ncbi:GIY-YIG nuclease family protein [Leptolyngbya sp. CCNP1308]|uniref:GIY-YIG nuclease family protein n=1 Tax=Leptolyngbya sp. CCNP1308 TaxID=3110255 RepID=UPI003A5991F7
MPNPMNESTFEAILNPTHLCSRPEVLARNCPVPRKAGVYAWYFRKVPPRVPTEGCHQVKATTLLYVGISPSKSSSSRQQLKERVRQHYNNNAFGSTLRLTLGCLLADELGIELRRVGSSGKRLTFTDGEQALSNWMEANALVTWMETPEPWVLEPQIISQLSLPLNLEHNESHPFYPVLAELRNKCRQRARQLPIWSDGALRGSSC